MTASLGSENISVQSPLLRYVEAAGWDLELSREKENA